MAADGSPARLVRFAGLTAVLWLVAVAGTAAIAPPDPVTQLLYAAPAATLAALVAYWLVYLDGAERIGALSGR